MIPLHRLEAFEADLDLASPNHGPRNADAIRLIVLHATADNGSERGAESWMRNPAAQVSAHLHIRRDGTIVRLVDDRRRAWHAGRSTWPGIADVNSESLGWELANRNDGKEPYSDQQYNAVAHLLRHYMPQGIARSEVVSHYDIAPGRKTDPRGFDWPRLWLMVDAPPPVVELVEGIVDRRNPIPHPGTLHPLRRPVPEIAKPGQTGEDFLQTAGEYLTPLMRGLWNVLVAAIMRRAEREVDEVLGNP